MNQRSDGDIPRLALTYDLASTHNVRTPCTPRGNVVVHAQSAGGPTARSM
jgi:hypothetical protein